MGSELVKYGNCQAFMPKKKHKKWIDNGRKTDKIWIMKTKPSVHMAEIQPMKGTRMKNKAVSSKDSDPAYALQKK